MRISALLSILIWFLASLGVRAENETQAATELIKKMSLKEEWSVKDLKEFGKKLDATSKKGGLKSRLADIRFHDSEDTISISFIMSRNGEPVGIWNIRLTSKNGTYIYKEHEWGDI